MTFHLNPKTGEPGRCRATITCPFGDLQTDHYETPEAAREAYEAKMQAFEQVKEYSMRLELSPQVETLLSDLVASGATPYVVGGSVRDALAVGAVPKDVDIEVYGVGSREDLNERLEAKGYFAKEVGRSFGVFTAKLADGTDVDISLPRKDSLVGEGHKDFVVEVDADLTLTEASSRRDFTVNALYYDHARQKVLDAHGGMEDWRAKRLAHIDEHFADDALRVMRGMQFAARFDLEVAPETAKETSRIRDGYASISQDRVIQEWQKLFTKGKDVTKGLKALRAMDWDSHFGLETTDLDAAGAHANASITAAREAGLSEGEFGAAAVALHLPGEKQNYFLQRSIVLQKDRVKFRTLMDETRPGDTSSKGMERFARELARKNCTVQEWLCLHGSGLNEGEAAGMKSAAVKSNSLTSATPDFITGKLILDATESKKGGPWVGKIAKAAIAAQDRHDFTDAAGARKWLDAHLAANPIAK